MFLLLALTNANAESNAQLQSVCASTETDATAVGQGTAADPWQLCTSAQLTDMLTFSSNDSELDGSFLLVDDIDMGGITWSKGIGQCNHFPTTHGFRGSFDGRGHSVSGLTIDGGTSHEAGGFLSCLNGGTLVDLQLVDITVLTDNAFYTGGAVGYSDQGLVEDVAVVGGDIRGDQDAGGVFGVTRDSDVARVSFDGDVLGGSNAGGLVGKLEWSRIEDSYCAGTVEADFNLGGLAGTANNNFVGLAVLRTYAFMDIIDPGAINVGTLVGNGGGGQFGTVGGNLDAVFTLDVVGTPLMGDGSLFTGTAVALDQAILVDESTYVRGGWDLVNVWNPPVAGEPPTLR